jgi:hypothetical protein
MSDAKRQLTDRSNRLLDALRGMREVEKRKRAEPISSPKFHALADEVDKVSRDVFRLARDEERLGDEIPRGSDTIDDVDHRDRTSAKPN